MTILSKNDQKGRSMVEMLGVLAIIGVLSVGGISGYSKAMAKFKMTKAQDQISMLLMNIRTAFATSPSYEGLDNGTAVSFAIAPGDMYSGKVSDAGSDAQLNNAFGGEAYVYACGEENPKYPCAGDNYASASADQYFAIAMTNLGREACVSLASSDWGTDGLVSIKILGGEVEDPFTADLLPLNMIDAGEACGDYGQTADIVWTYY